MSGSSFQSMALRADELGCDRGGKPVFRGVNFTLETGAGLVLRGDNGAGKSSLLRLIAGLTPHSEGDVYIRHGNQEWQRGNAAGHVAWQGHEDAHKPALSARENLKFWINIHHSKMALAEALEQVGLAPLADTPVGQFSAGQKRRLALARLIVQCQPIWLMDEPTAALDAKAAKLSEELTAAHLAAGGIAIIATHNVFVPQGRVSELNLVAA